jgi:hypothetical protein
MRKAIWVTCVVLFALFAAGAHADDIEGTGTNFFGSTQITNFSEIPLPANTPVTTQYAGLGITFSPGVFYDPQNGTEFGLPLNDVGNYQDFSTAHVDPVTINFSQVQTGVEFLMAADGTPYLFEALNGGQAVDFFTTTVNSPALFYGFFNVPFDQIEISQAGTGGGPYWLISDIETGVSPAPEPPSLALLGIGLLGLAPAVRWRLPKPQR